VFLYAFDLIELNGDHLRLSKLARLKMLEIAIVLIVGFGLGYGVREWISRRRRQAERQRHSF